MNLKAKINQFTYPIKIAVQLKIPLIIWGEEGFSELTGMFNQDDMIEFTKMKRQEHDMRGYEPEDLIANPKADLDPKDLAPYFYPSDEEVENLKISMFWRPEHENYEHRVFWWPGQVESPKISMFWWPEHAKHMELVSSGDQNKSEISKFRSSGGQNMK